MDGARVAHRAAPCHSVEPHDAQLSLRLLEDLSMSP